MHYEPLYHKYRPQSFAELVGQDAISQTLSNALNQQRIAHAYLFTGPRGTGKTSSARILAKSLNCIKGDAPTDSPCGVCDICRSITQGNSLDVIEIDAASNTGVDNIRELIERAQFAPAQCRYKVYVVDECLTGDTLVLTDHGPIRIDDSSIQGKTVLSYHEISGKWEFKPVVRWLDQGKRQTFIIKTTQREIRCTGNHLIRTDQGWIAAKDVNDGMKILSPANADATRLSTSMGSMVGSGDLPQAISLKAIPMDKKPMILKPSLHKQQPLVPFVLVDAVKNLLSRSFLKRKVKEFKAFNPIGEGIHTILNTVSGIVALNPFSIVLPSSALKSLVSYMALSWETVPSLIPISTAASHVCLGHMETHKKLGWNIKHIGLRCCIPNLERLRIEGMARFLSAVIQPAIHNLSKYFSASSPISIRKKSLKTGSKISVQKGWHGGTWMMVPLALAQRGVHKFNFIPKDILLSKINSSLIGLPLKAILPSADLTVVVPRAKPTTTLSWERMQHGDGLPTFRNMQSQLWHTNLETVESVSLGGIEPVYDIEVEDNHNFVANGLLVHNCHMLSTAAFNALLKTLEEPPPRVVFVLATTDPQRVLPTIISRCQRFDFRRIPLDAMVAHLVAIAAKEQISIEPSAVQLVGQLAQGGLRDAESLLDQLSLLPTTITPEAVWDLVGAVPEQSLLQLVQMIHHGSPEQILDCVRELMDRGREPLIVLQNLAGFYRDMLIAKTAPDRADLVAITTQTWVQLCEFVQDLDIELLLRGQQHLRSTEVQVKNTSQPRLWLEITLLGLIPSALAPASVTPLPTRNFHSPSPQVIVPSQQPITPDAAVAHSSPISPPSTVAPSPVQLVNENRSPTPANPDIASTASPVPPVATLPVSSSISTDISPPVVPETAPEIAPTVPTRETAAFAVPTPASDQSLPPEVDLTETWNQVIAHIQPALTQVLARQQCRLLGFRGSQARVGVKTQALLKIAQSKLPNFEAAFQTVFQRLVKVTVEVIATDNPTTPAPAAPTVTATPAYTPQTFGNLATPPSPAFPTQPSALPSQPILTTPLPSSSLQSDGTLPPNPEPQVALPEPLSIERSPTAPSLPSLSPVAPVEPSALGIQSPLPTPHSSVASLELLTPEVSAAVIPDPVETPSSWTPPDELDRAVRSLAELFRGQVVSLESGESGHELEIGGDGFTWDAAGNDFED